MPRGVKPGEKGNARRKEEKPDGEGKASEMASPHLFFFLPKEEGKVRGNMKDRYE